MNFPSINIQGNILSGEILEKIRNEELKNQTPASFGFDKNTKVRDEIGLAWSAVRGLWQTFTLRRERIAPDDSGTTETRNFWMLPFLTTLGFDVEKSVAEVIDNKTYAISHRAANLDGFPIHIAGFNDSLDKRRETGGPRLSPHALVQEYLNKTDNHLYAIVTNGRHLRLLRDATRLVRMTYLEFDLEKMIEEELFSDFAILFRVLHASRMPTQSGDGELSIIEQYHQDSLEAGGRIREKLSNAVEYAIKQLANGFLQHPANEHLRQQVSTGQISPDSFYLHSLRLVYRMLFLLVIEDRGLVYPDKLDDEAKKLRTAYLDFYSMNRLRRMAERKRFVDGNKHDLWENLKVAFRIFEQQKFGQKLNIQSLASGIFHQEALGVFNQCKLSNETLLEVMQRICYFLDPERKLMVKVNYGDLDVEEFGSVYEGLLEFKPVFDEMDGKPRFSFRAGTQRSSSGSHYTPEELVRPLIQHSLDYIIQDCLTKPHERLAIQPGQMPGKNMKEKALLAIKVCDVSCGSGHILLSAARRIATELARVRTGEDQPSPEAMRHAIRDTIRHCIYGVDLNPLAVELCKVALWLEAHNPGEPLNFLDHRIKCGDSIVGLAHREELENGIADEAFKTLPGDEKEVAAAFRKRNAAEIKQKDQSFLQFDEPVQKELSEVIKKFKLFESLPERTPEEIEGKERQYRKYETSVGRIRLKQLADAQVAQFFIPKTTATKHLLMTDADYRNFLRQVNKGLGPIQSQKVSYANEIVGAEKRFFHWFIEFPEVFAQGGFDCVLGNPPYLGGKRISGNYGDDYIKYLKTYYTPSEGSVDLISYFVRRYGMIIRSGSFTAFISTNSISQGDTRVASLEELGKYNCIIIFAHKNIKWPGVAAVEISLLGLFSGDWKGAKYLNGIKTKNISTLLDDDLFEFRPNSLFVNRGKSFQGSIILGDGFVISNEAGKRIIESNNIYKQVIYPYLIGDNVNSISDQKNSRSVINFFDWDVHYCKSHYPICFEKVEKLVKPERMLLKDKGYKEKWWQYGRRGVDLYNSISENKRVLVVPQTTKYLGFSFVPNGQVISGTCIVFSMEDFFRFSVLQSILHEAWVWKFPTTMGSSTLRYVNSQCFETFPFPQNLNPQQEQQLETLGETYHEHRRQLMLSMQLGLTKTYNAFHAPEVQPGITTAMLQGLDNKTITKKYGKEVWNLWNHLQRKEGACTLEEAIAGIVRLRELHTEMDNAVLEAYGWGETPVASASVRLSAHAEVSATGSPDTELVEVPGTEPVDPPGTEPVEVPIQLKHDFYEVDYLPENDRIRYTIHPEARKEVLKRLLQLNHQYFEQEALEGKHKEETVRKFYEQKGTAIPEDVSKWFRKGKEYKKPNTTLPIVNEPEEGYGGLFNQ